jgi:hypothetical protein
MEGHSQKTALVLIKNKMEFFIVTKAVSKGTFNSESYMEYPLS